MGGRDYLRVFRSRKKGERGVE